MEGVSDYRWQKLILFLADPLKLTLLDTAVKKILTKHSLSEKKLRAVCEGLFSDVSARIGQPLR